MIAFRINNGLFVLIAPFVAFLAAASVWLSLTAAIENYRASRVSDQILVAISRAREGRISSSFQPAQAQNILVQGLEQFDGMETLFIGGSERGVKNPWGRPIRVYVYPAERAVRFEQPLSAAACRKMLSFYAEDAVSLGLQRVDIRDNLPSALWRMVYEKPRTGAAGIGLKAIEAGCNNEAGVLVSLTFSL